jgi:hypothetical protein
MKLAIRTLTILLIADLGFLAYVWIIRSEHYFPDRYEDAFRLTALALPVAVLLAGTIAVMALRIRRIEKRRLQ